MTPLYCCPEKFTLNELQSIIETLIGKKIQRKSLMRRVEQSDMLIPLDETGGNLGRKAKAGVGFQVSTRIDIG